MKESRSNDRQEKREEVKRRIDRRDGIEVADGESERREESRRRRLEKLMQ